MGLHNAAKYYYTTGWHEPATTSELIIAKPAWDALPDDVKAIVRVASMDRVMESVSWSEAVNGDALVDLVENEGVIANVLPQAVVEELRTATADTLATEAAKDPLVQKLHDSYMAFKSGHDAWAGISKGPWHSTILRT